MEALAIGLGLGLAAGFSPGPLLTLVLTSTLQRGAAAGLRVAAAPLLTDLPIVVAAIALASSISQGFLSFLGLFGGTFVVFLGFGTWRDSRAARLGVDSEDEGSAKAKDLLSGALVNVLSPHPWLFWMGIGAPQVVQLHRSGGWLGSLGFLSLFYFGLVGSKALLAVWVGRGRSSLSDALYRRILVACSLFLIFLGIWLMIESGTTWIETRKEA